MEVLALKFAVTEEDVNGLLARHLGADQPVRDLKVSLTPQGARVTGAYPVAFFSVKFDTLWALSVRGREVAARLAELHVAGAPAGIVRGTLLEMLAAQIEQEEGLRVEGEALLVDPDRLLGRLGPTVRTNLTAVRCEAGRVVVEGGTPGA